MSAFKVCGVCHRLYPATSKWISVGTTLISPEAETAETMYICDICVEAATRLDREVTLAGGPKNYMDEFEEEDKDNG